MERCALDHGLEGEKVVFYYFPMDMAVFRPYTTRKRENLREKLGIGGSEIIITYIGRISADKGLPYLLESIMLLMEKYGERVKFVVVGDGPLLDWFLENTLGIGIAVCYFWVLYMIQDRLRTC